jgi:hypothetical protein
MKNLLLLLLLANILYFMWGKFAVDEPQPGIAVVSESDLGPPLQVTTEQDVYSIASVGAVLGSGDPSDLEAVVGRSCVTIGPFKAVDDADLAVLEYRKEGMMAVSRSATGQIFVGHWVQIRNVPDETVADTMLKTLSDGGLTDAYMVRTEDEGLKISLGRSLELEADISPRMRDGTVFFVDIGLLPGKGAGAIVEKYGEDRVALRDEATCPL